MRQLSGACIVEDMCIRMDPAGDGNYHASRDDGHKRHSGIDYQCEVGAGIFSPVAGKVTKHGHAYPNDNQYRYVQITDDEGLDHRIYYCLPGAPLGKMVTTDTVIGISQDISRRYPGELMKPHIHYEVMDSAGDYRNPAK